MLIGTICTLGYTITLVLITIASINVTAVLKTAEFTRSTSIATRWSLCGNSCKTSDKNGATAENSG
jgi:hypothetical protein